MIDNFLKRVLPIGIREKVLFQVQREITLPLVLPPGFETQNNFRAPATHGLLWHHTMTPFYQLLTNGGNYLGEFSNSEMQWKYFNQRQIIFRYRRATVKGSPPIKKNVFFRALPELPFPPTPPSPQFGQLGPLFSDVKIQDLKVT